MFSHSARQAHSVPAVLYSYTHYKDDRDFYHGVGTTISEIFIPKYNIIYNKNETLRAAKPRTDFGQTKIELSKASVDKIISLLEAHEELAADEALQAVFTTNNSKGLNHQ